MGATGDASDGGAAGGGAAGAVALLPTDPAGALAAGLESLAATPAALHATLAVGELDGALLAVERLGGDADPDRVRARARALGVAGRCADARRLDPTVCG